MKSILQPALMLAIFVAFAVMFLAPAAAYADACIYDDCTATACGTSGTQTATNWPCDDPQTITCEAPACPFCTYGPCDATVCGTVGQRIADNQPCTGEAIIACAAPPCPLCTYGPCDALTCGTTGTRFANNQPCVGESTEACNAPACPPCFYGVCDATVCGTSGLQFAVNQPCDGTPSVSCSAPACPACTYDLCSATVCGTQGTQSANNEPCIGESTILCDAPTCPICSEESCTSDYSYTGASFDVVSGNRFSATDSITASFSIDCGLAGGTGDCRSLAFADHAAAVTSCEFIASGAPDLIITCANALPGYFFRFETDAEGQLSGAYNIGLDSSLEGGNGARITTNDSGGFTVARSGAAGGEGRVDYAPGLWMGLAPVLAAPVPLLQPIGLGALVILLGASVMIAKRKS